LPLAAFDRAATGSLAEGASDWATGSLVELFVLEPFVPELLVLLAELFVLEPFLPGLSVPVTELFVLEPFVPEPFVFADAKLRAAYSS